MVMLDRPRIEVDFNEMVAQDLVLLSREDVKRDSSGELIEMQVGLRVYLYAEDADEGGVPCFLLATGIVERHNPDERPYPLAWRSVRWRCRIDMWES